MGWNIFVNHCLSYCIGTDDIQRIKILQNQQNRPKIEFPVFRIFAITYPIYYKINKWNKMKTSQKNAITKIWKNIHIQNTDTFCKTAKKIFFGGLWLHNHIPGSGSYSTGNSYSLILYRHLLIRCCISIKLPTSNKYR